jgi:hypothetical protein
MIRCDRGNNLIDPTAIHDGLNPKFLASLRARRA